MVSSPLASPGKPYYIQHFMSPGKTSSESHAVLPVAKHRFPMLQGNSVKSILVTGTEPHTRNPFKFKIGEIFNITLYWSAKLIFKYYANKHLNTFSSVQFSRSVVYDSLRPHESQHARPPFPSPAPRVYSNSCPSSRWCHPAISSSVIPFSSYPQSLPASGSFPMSQLFAWGGQSIGVKFF